MALELSKIRVSTVISPETTAAPLVLSTVIGNSLLFFIVHNGLWKTKYHFFKEPNFVFRVLFDCMKNKKRYVILFFVFLILIRSYEKQKRYVTVWFPFFVLSNVKRKRKRRYVHGPSYTAGAMRFTSSRTEVHFRFLKDLTLTDSLSAMQLFLRDLIYLRSCEPYHLPDVESIS